MTEVAQCPARSLSERIMETVRNDEIELPPFPALAVHLQQLLSKDDTDAGDVAETVALDPALVAGLLRIANSAAFGGLQPITNPKQAIARLGLTQVGAISSALLLKGQFESENAENQKIIDTLWDHSVTSAFAARILAEEIGADTSQAFLAGLLHDCGKLLVLRCLDHLVAGGLEVERTDALLTELMENLHCEIGHLALTTWELPETLAQVVLHHEDSPEDIDEDLVLQCVQAADLITRKLGFDLDPDPELPLLEEPAIENLDIEDITLAGMMVDLEDRLEELRKLF